MLILANYAYHRPSTVDEAMKLLAEEGSLIIAGGSDVMPQLKTAVIEPKSLVDLALIEDCRPLRKRKTASTSAPWPFWPSWPRTS